MSKSVAEYLKQRVLDAAANDYENLSTIAADVQKWAAADKKHFSAADLDNAVQSLVRDARLGVFEYSEAQRKYVRAVYAEENKQNLWFLTV